jgi:hypothetical protein
LLAKIRAKSSMSLLWIIDYRARKWPCLYHLKM